MKLYIFMAEKKETKTIGVKLISAWIFSVLFIVGGIGILFSSFLSGIFTFMAGLILLPPFNKFLEKKYKLKITTWLKILIVLVLLVFSGMAMSNESSDKSNAGNLGLTDNSNLQNTQTTTPAVSKSWHQVTSFSGKGNQDTSSFYIKGDKVKIIATTCCGMSGIGTYSAVDLEKEEGGYLGAGLSISTDGSEEGQGETTYRNLDAGQYYISVITGVNWEVEIEEYY